MVAPPPHGSQVGISHLGDHLGSGRRYTPTTPRSSVGSGPTRFTGVLDSHHCLHLPQFIFTLLPHTLGPTPHLGFRSFPYTATSHTLWDLTVPHISPTHLLLSPSLHHTHLLHSHTFCLLGFFHTPHLTSQIPTGRAHLPLVYCSHLHLPAPPIPGPCCHLASLFRSPPHTCTLPLHYTALRQFHLPHLWVPTYTHCHTLGSLPGSLPAPLSALALPPCLCPACLPAHLSCLPCTASHLPLGPLFHTTPHLGPSSPGFTPGIHHTPPLPLPSMWRLISGYGPTPPHSIHSSPTAHHHYTSGTSFTLSLPPFFHLLHTAHTHTTTHTCLPPSGFLTSPSLHCLTHTTCYFLSSFPLTSLTHSHTVFLGSTTVHTLFCS